MDYTTANIRYLLLEDEYYTALNIKRILSNIRPGYSLAGECASVSLAISALRAAKDINLIITDMQLADGMALDALKACDCKIPIIVFTAYDHYRTMLDGFNLVDYVLKPVSAVEIRNSIEKYEKSITTKHLTV